MFNDSLVFVFLNPRADHHPSLVFILSRGEEEEKKRNADPDLSMDIAC